MSIIAAVIREEDEGESFEIGLASDGQANYGDGYCALSTPKMKIFGEDRSQFVVGVVGSFRVLDLVFEHDWSELDFRDQKSVLNFRNGVADIVSEESSKTYVSLEDLGFQLILACGQGLYVMYADMQIAKCERYCAVGSGYEVASGSLFRDFKLGLCSVEEAVVGAVEAANRHRSDCGLGGSSITLRVGNAYSKARVNEFTSKHMRNNYL